MKKKVKFSIIIPSKNTLKYLKDNVESIIGQKYDDYELIICDNHSNDGTYEWVNSLKNPHVTLIRPKEPLLMTENFAFALSHANGDWIQMLGADDGVQPFYFQLADYFIKKAENNNISVINFPRAYFFWEGCESIYNDAGISFIAHAGYTIKNTKYALLSALISENVYFNIPHLYTMSIIHHSMIENIKKNSGVFYYSTCIHDASSAASVCSFGGRYLQSFIPLTWVGTSNLAVGFPSSEAKNNEINMTLARDLKWNRQMGTIDIAFCIKELHFYLYEAVLQCRNLQTIFWKLFFSSKWFKTLVFANVFAIIEKSQQKVDCLVRVLDLNKIPLKRVVFFRSRILPFVYRVFRRMDGIYARIYRLEAMKKIEYNLPRAPESKLSIMDAYKIIDELNKKTCFVENFINRDNFREENS